MGDYRWEIGWSSGGGGIGMNIALLILNMPITLNLKTFTQLWTNAKIKVCADGGANRLYEYVPEQERNQFIPDYIKGDLDSIQPHVENYYSNNGTKIIMDHSQDNTDFNKCLLLLQDVQKQEANLGKWEGEMVVVSGGLDGRFDQQIEILNSVYAFQNEFRFQLVGKESAVCMLKKGYHRFNIDKSVAGKFCGLAALNNNTLAKTQGFQWNLDGTQPLSLGGFISSSNAFADGDDKTELKIEIETDNNLLFSFTLHPQTQRLPQ